MTTRRMRRLAIAGMVTAVVVFWSATAAAAFWLAASAGTGTAGVGTLAPPTGVGATQQSGTGTVAVSWSAPVGTPAASGYYVQRSGTGTVAACGTSPLSTIAATSCSDMSVPLGSYTYTVTAVYRSWSTSSTASAIVTVAAASQTVTFTSTAPANATVGGPSYTPTATATSGLPVTITVDSSASSVCAISGGVVSFTHSGTCTLDGNQSGSTYWSAAPQKQQSFTVASASATHFSVTAGATQAAGTAFSLTITAQDTSGNTVTVYSGNHTITLTSNASNSPGGATPTLPSGTVSFTSGVATVTGVTLVDVQTARTVTASDGTISGTTAGITVSAGAAARLAWTAFSPANSGCFFTCTYTGLGGSGTTFKAKIQLTDAEGNAVTAASQLTITVGHSGGTFAGSATVTIASGQSTSNGGGDGSVPGEITFKTDTGSWTTDTLSMTSTPTSYTGAAAGFAK